MDHGNGIQVLKKSTAEMREQFDFILMDNSFERLPDPAVVDRRAQLPPETLRRRLGFSLSINSKDPRTLK